MEKTIVYRYEVNPTDLQIQHLSASNELIGETQKNRKLYQLHNMTVHIDELSNGERYIEIEAKDFDDSYTENEAISNCKIE
jgi:adenylate cyclase class IV